MLLVFIRVNTALLTSNGLAGCWLCVVLAGLSDDLGLY